MNLTFWQPKLIFKNPGKISIFDAFKADSKSFRLSKKYRKYQPE